MTVAPDVDGSSLTSLPTATVVIGMHRSGTSLLTRMLNLLGLGLGAADDLMPPHERDNPTGYWEHLDVVGLNDEILGALGGSWDRPPLLEDGWEFEADLDQFRTRAGEIVGSIVGCERPVPGASTRPGPSIGWKDPRCSLLLPFWKTVIPVRATIVAVRHPFQVAASLARRDRMTPEQAAWLWSRHVVAAWRGHRNRAIVDYDMAVADPESCAVHLASFLGLDQPSDAVLTEVRSFVDGDLAHDPGVEIEVGPAMALALSLFAMVQSQPFSLVDGVVDAIHAHWVVTGG